MGRRAVERAAETEWNDPKMAMYGGVLGIGGIGSLLTGTILMARGDGKDDFEPEESYYSGAAAAESPAEASCNTRSEMKRS